MRYIDSPATLGFVIIFPLVQHKGSILRAQSSRQKSLIAYSFAESSGSGPQCGRAADQQRRLETEFMQTQRVRCSRAASIE